MVPVLTKSMMVLRGKNKEEGQRSELQNGAAKGPQQRGQRSREKTKVAVSKPPKTPKSASSDLLPKDIRYYAQKLAGSLNIAESAEDGGRGGA